MEHQLRRTATLGTALLVTVGALGCAGKVDEEVFDDEVSEIRSTIEDHESRISQNEGDIEELRGRISNVEESLRGELERLRRDFQARITELEDAVRFALPVHFEFDKAELRSVDRPILDRFASVAKKYYGDAKITVEGFADPAGSRAYNERLSERRAQAVKSYLTEQHGLNADRIATAGYGETRLVMPGKQGPGREGLENRRVVFVVEYGGSVNVASGGETEG